MLEIWWSQGGRTPDLLHAMAEIFLRRHCVKLDRIDAVANKLEVGGVTRRLGQMSIQMHYAQIWFVLVAVTQW